MNSSEPDAYTCGWKKFYNRYFSVNSDVLIPRMETEGLVDIVLDEIDSPIGNKLYATDIGTGCGCIGITVSLELDKRGVKNTVYCTDISESALTVAKNNAQRLGSKNTVFLRSDLLENLPSDVRLEIIIANLPYVPHRRINYLDSSVKDYEPHLALDGGNRGLEHIHKFLAAPRIKRAKQIFLEIDDTHTTNDFKKYTAGFNIELRKDFFGRNRYLILQPK